MSRLIGKKMRGHCLRSFLRTFILRTKWCVFFNVQENKHFKTVNFFGFYVYRNYAENIGIMRKMRISVNYADLHRRILSDAVYCCAFNNFLLKSQPSHSTKGGKSTLNDKAKEDEPTSKKRKIYKFQRAELNEFELLEWDSEKELMHCRYCKAFPMHSSSSLVDGPLLAEVPFSFVFAGLTSTGKETSTMGQNSLC